jgi:hypothetical protein
VSDLIQTAAPEASAVEWLAGALTFSSFVEELRSAAIAVRKQVAVV